MRRALSYDQYEDRPGYPCVKGTTRTERDSDGVYHVYRMVTENGLTDWSEILPSPEWDETPFDDLSLPYASGDAFEQLAEALQNAAFRTVREFLVAYHAGDERLDRLVYPGDAHLMRVDPEQVRLFVEHLSRRRVECETWRTKQ